MKRFEIYRKLILIAGTVIAAVSVESVREVGYRMR